MFKRVVMVPSHNLPGEQLGFVTGEIHNEYGSETLAVFLPAAPNPTNGKRIYVREHKASSLDPPKVVTSSA